MADADTSICLVFMSAVPVKFNTRKITSVISYFDSLNSLEMGGLKPMR